MARTSTLSDEQKKENRKKTNKKYYEKNYERIILRQKNNRMNNKVVPANVEIINREIIHDDVSLQTQLVNGLNSVGFKIFPNWFSVPAEIEKRNCFKFTNPKWKVIFGDNKRRYLNLFLFC